MILRLRRTAVIANSNAPNRAIALRGRVVEVQNLFAEFVVVLAEGDQGSPWKARPALQHGWKMMATSPRRRLKYAFRVQLPGLWRTFSFVLDCLTSEQYLRQALSYMI